MMREKQVWQAINDASGCMVGMVKCQKWVDFSGVFRHVYIHFPMTEERVWTKRVFLTDISGGLRGVASVFTYDSIEAVAQSESMQPEDLPEVTAL